MGHSAASCCLAGKEAVVVRLRLRPYVILPRLAFRGLPVKVAFMLRCAFMLLLFCSPTALSGCAGSYHTYTGLPRGAVAAVPSTTFAEQIAAYDAPPRTATLPARVGGGRTLPVQGPPVQFGYIGGEVR